MMLPGPSPASGACVTSLECAARVKVNFMTSTLKEVFQPLSTSSVRQRKLSKVVDHFGDTIWRSVSVVFVDKPGSFSVNSL